MFQITACAKLSYNECDEGISYITQINVFNFLNRNLPEIFIKILRTIKIIVNLFSIYFPYIFTLHSLFIYR